MASGNAPPPCRYRRELSRSVLVCQRTQECVSRYSACARIVPGPSSPSACAHWIGVWPWRRIISRTSTTLCAACTVNGSPRSRAASWLSRSSSGVQVSICIGDTTPESLPLGCASAASMTSSAAANPSRPRASSQAYSSSRSFSMYQRAEAYPGARNPRSPLCANSSTQPFHGGDTSTRVVTPERSSSQ